MGDRIRKLMAEQGFNPLSLAKRSRVGYGTIRRMMLDQVNPGVDKIRKVATALGTSSEYLLEGFTDTAKAAMTAKVLAMNPEILSGIVSALEEYLEEEQLNIPPKKKGEFIVSLYDYCLMFKVEPQKPVFRDYLKKIVPLIVK